MQLTIQWMAISVNERALISQIAKQDEAALECLYKLYYARLVRFLWRLTNQRENIIEIVNDTFYAVWNGAPNFRGQSTVSTWILGIAYKKGLQKLRDDKAFPAVQEEACCELGEVALEERHNTQLLRLLEPHHRIVMELSYYFGYSYREIAAIIDCPENTVKTRMHYGRRCLRQLMRETNYDKSA